MKPVHFRKLPKLLLSRAIVSFLLVIVLVACGTNAVTTSSPAQPHPSSPANISENASTSLNLNPANISIKTGNVLIQSRGFDCPDGNLGNAYYEDQLVLASDRMTYSQDEITQMRSYVLGSISAGTGSGISKYATVTPSLPTLHWVLGGNNVGTGGGSGNGCGATLNVTNTGNTPIQIPEISIQVKASPQPNTYHYRLIDACSFLTPEEVSNGGCLPTGSAGGGPCNLSSVSFQLGSREKNQLLSAQLSAPVCGTLTIAPATQVPLILAFPEAVNKPFSLIYSILPILTINAGQGDQKVPLTQLASTLAFANANQFSCYQLHGTTFALLPSITLSGSGKEFAWCM